MFVSHCFNTRQKTIYANTNHPHSSPLSSPPPIYHPPRLPNSRHHNHHHTICQQHIYSRGRTGKQTRTLGTDLTQTLPKYNGNWKICVVLSYLELFIYQRDIPDRERRGKQMRISWTDLTETYFPDTTETERSVMYRLASNFIYTNEICLTEDAEGNK